ncbi:aquaporin AQPAe.a [Patella vulgata]|uniref:aquaporin AQPAe.a n=1 Tax=Patella vulgata TaxID=6465 RepID=UPI0021803273|nr:aquaporin AQPAe.a [Patella vulgata]
MPPTLSLTSLHNIPQGQEGPNCCQTFIMEEMDDLRKPAFWKAVIGEFLGCLFLIFFTVGAGLHEEGTRGHGTVHIALSSGFFIAVIVTVLLTISGGHINPAVSIGFAVNREISFVRFIFYCIAQTGGSVAGAALLKAITPESKVGNLGILLPEPNVTTEQALYSEIVITFFLLFSVFAMIDKDRKDVQGSVPFIIGLVVAVNIFYGINISGGAMNPVRAFGPAVVMGRLEHQWIYWAGPLVGGVLGAFLYDKFFSVAATHTAVKSCCLGSGSYKSVSTIEDPVRKEPTNFTVNEKVPLTGSTDGISSV